MKVNKAKIIQGVVVAAWMICCFCFFQYYYPNHFFFKEQNQIFYIIPSTWTEYLYQPHPLARLIGDFLTQFYCYKFHGAIIITVAIAILGDLVCRLLRLCKVNKYIALVIAVIAMTLEALMHTGLHYQLSATVVKIFFVVFLYSAIFCFKRRKIYVILPLAAWLIVTLPWKSAYPREWKEYVTCPELWKMSTPDFVYEYFLSVDNAYYRHNYDKVVELVENCPGEYRTKEMLFFYYLVQAQRGTLPDKLMRFGDPDELGTFYHISAETPMTAIKNINELYWALGDMTYAERAAMMSNVFSKDNRNIRMIQRLAEINIVKNDTTAAKKYLKIVGNTLIRRYWAWNAWKDERLMEKRQYVNKQDTMQAGDNAHWIMMQLLDSNPRNTVALDYMLCSDLLLKDMDSFKRDYDKYCVETGMPRNKKLYQEALCIYLAGTNAPVEEWQRYIIDTSVLKRFNEYNAKRGNSMFSDTYWYYFDVKGKKR